MSPRTKLFLYLVLAHIFVVNSDVSYDKDSLLRGSGEERDRESGDVIADDETGVKSVAEDYEAESSTEYSTTTDVPEAIGLRIPEEGKEDDDRAESKEAEHKKEVEDDAHTVEPIDATTDMLSVTDNTVYTNNVSDLDAKVTTVQSPQPPTEPPHSSTRPIDEMEAAGPTLVALEEPDSPEQRSMKSGGSKPETQPPLETPRHFEPEAPPVTKTALLRSWLEDPYTRQPAGILVPLRPLALSRLLAIWKDLTADGMKQTDVVLVGYDANGINWRSRHNLQHSSKKNGYKTITEALSKLILKYQGVSTDTADGTMRALTSAAKLVPYDSALFVVTEKAAGDAQRMPLALKALLEKRLKVYTIWTDPNYPSAASQKALQDLKNVSLHTDGTVLPYSIQVMDLDGNTAQSDQQWDAMDQAARQGRGNFVGEEKLDTLLVRRGGGEAISLGVPVENGVSALRIYIEGLVEHAVLYPPNDGPQIDLYNTSSVSAFSPQSRTDRLSPRDIYLVFPGAGSEADSLSVLPMPPPAPEAPAPTVGLWHLSVRCDTCDYRLCVTARSLVHLTANIEHNDMLKLRVTGPVASVRESQLLDEYGTELAKLPFSYQPIAGDRQEPTEMLSELVKDLPLPKVKGSRVYAKIVGRDFRGEPFVRLAGPLNQELRTGRSAALEQLDELERAEDANSRLYQQLRYNESTILPFNRAVSQVVNQRGTLLTSVQIGLSTRLYAAPGDNLQLHFEVTNYREQAVRFSFGAVGELRFLRGINPTSQTIPSGQTQNVIVSLAIANNAQPGARDLITFTAYGIEQVSISAYVYVSNTGEAITDFWAPELRHNFQGSCIGRQGSDCAQHIWSATIIARDAVGGLLRMASSPIGLTYDSNFIAGSRDEVVATYRATCCAPRVMVTAVDAFGNANSYIVDISSYFSGAAIAAIVLGVFLLLALIALVIFLIYWCLKRRRESRELPTYATTSRN